MELECGQSLIEERHLPYCCGKEGRKVICKEKKECPVCVCYFRDEEND